MTWTCSLIIGYLLIHQIRCEYYRQCYNVSDYQHCLSTDLTMKTWQDAKDACVANNSVLISVTSSHIQSALEQFRSNVSLSKLDIANGAVWIDVHTDTVDGFHWITGDRGITGLTIDGQDGTNYDRFGAINLNAESKTAFYAQTWNTLSFYICQYAGAVSCNDGYRHNSVCYRKYNNETVTWFTASSRCLSMEGSLATFNDLTKPTDAINLTSWLNITGTTGYWVALVNRWLVTTIHGGSTVDVRYTNWESGNPSQQPSDTDKRCVALMSHNSTWIDTVSCTSQQRFICQAVTQLASTTTTTTTSSTTTTRSTSTHRSSTKLSLPLTSSSTNVVNGGPDGQSSTPIPATNGSTSGKQESPTSSVALGVGVGVGVGVPVIIVIVAIVVVLLIKCRQNKRTQHESKSPTTSSRKQQNEDARNKDGGGMEMMENVEALEGSLSTRHLIDNNTAIYADIAPSNHAVYANTQPRNTDVKQQPLPDVVYAEFGQFNGQQTSGRGDVSPTLSTTAA